MPETTENSYRSSPGNFTEKIHLVCFGTAGGGGLGDRLPEASPRPRQPPFAAPALRELESVCRVSICWDAITVPTVCFSGVLRGSPEGSAAVCDPNPLRPFARYRSDTPHRTMALCLWSCGASDLGLGRKVALIEDVHCVSSVVLRTLFPLTAFKNARDPKFAQNSSQRLFWGVPVRGTEIWKIVSKFVRKLPFFFQFLTNFTLVALQDWVGWGIFTVIPGYLRRANGDSQHLEARPELQDWLRVELPTVKNYRTGPFSK